LVLITYHLLKVIFEFKNLMTLVYFNKNLPECSSINGVRSNTLPRKETQISLAVLWFDTSFGVKYLGRFAFDIF